MATTKQPVQGSTTGTAARETAPHVRRLFDERNRVWVVQERIGDLTTHPNRRSLVFAAEHAMRRLFVYPDDWHTLSDDELLALSWGR